MVAPWAIEKLSVENSEFLIKGLVIGLAIAAPVGPIGCSASAAPWRMGV
jgi:hypothetical protein